MSGSPGLSRRQEWIFAAVILVVGVGAFGVIALSLLYSSRTWFLLFVLDLVVSAIIMATVIVVYRRARARAEREGREYRPPVVSGNPWAGPTVALWDLALEQGERNLAAQRGQRRPTSEMGERDNGASRARRRPPPKRHS